MRVGKRAGADLKPLIPHYARTSGDKSIIGANTRKQKLTSMPGVPTRAPGSHRRDYAKAPKDQADTMVWSFGRTGLTGES